MRKVKFLSPDTVSTIDATSWQKCSESCPQTKNCNFWHYDTLGKKCELIRDYFDIDTSSTHLLGKSKSRKIFKKWV